MKTDKTVLVLRTSDKDGKAHGGFQWPASGLVECPDWNPKAECGNGLHGILWPEGYWSDIKYYENELWQVVSVLEKDIVRIDGKVKFPRGEVIYSGELAVALNMVAKRFLEDLPAFIAEQSKVKPEESSSGNSAKIGSSGDSAQIGSSGYYAKIGSSGDYAQIDSSGKDAVIACAANPDKFRLGENGCICAPYQDKENRNRFAIGYEGENLKKGVWYQLTNSGEFVEIPS